MPAGSATAHAPATVANVAVGFDVLGFALRGPGDRVTVTRVDAGGEPVAIESIVADGTNGADAELPLDAQRNTASVALLAMVRDQHLRCGFRVRIVKGIPLGSGMGGSAASAVGAVVAANALLGEPLPRARLFDYALAGEAAASGARHPDNVAPCLFGGLVATLPGDPPHNVAVPVPASWCAVVVRPRHRVDTRAARAVLAPTVSLAAHSAQTAYLAGFMAACLRGDFELLSRSLRDTLIEPQRRHLIPGFAAVQGAALAAGAAGCSIAGSGPSMFAWTANSESAAAVRDAMLGAFTGAGIQADAWISPVAGEAARVVARRDER